MKKLLAILLLAASAPALGQAQTGLRGDSADSALEAAAPLPEVEAIAVTGADADAVVERASAWLNGLEGLKGRFLQLNPDGSVSEGDFFLQRPGKLRFAYDAPSPLLVVADGRTVAQIDSALETVDRVALDATPLSYLLKSRVDLAADARVRGVARQDGLALISLDDPDSDIAGQIVLVFSEPEFALREWVVVDEYGGQTRVILNNLTREASLDPDLFVYDADAGSRRPGQR